MTTLLERTTNLWNNVRRSEANLPTRISIPVSQTDKSLGETFKPDQNYFQVRVNEMFLEFGRQWFSTYLPLVTFISEFTYNREPEVVPFVVGPGMIEDKGTKLPNQGMLFTNTRVAGLHPYRGGRITMTAILYRTERTNYARNLLTVVENAVGILDMATSLGMYTKIASVVLDGLEALFNTGDTEPIVGWRQEFDPDAGDKLKPGYFVLINQPEAEIDQNKIWVRDDKLYYGDSLNSAKPYRAADYVLYSLVQTSERTDIEMLPFQDLWDRVRQDAEQPSETHWKSAKANMMSLYQSLTASPDLTAAQAKALANSYLEKMKESHEFALAIGDMEAGPHRIRTEEDAAREEVVEESVSILDL
jgi:hypothetical protein